MPSPLRSIDSAVERLPAREHFRSVTRSAASLSLRSGCFVRINFVPRKRDHESSPKCHCKILRKRNGSASTYADFLGNENKDSSEGPTNSLLRSTSATDTRSDRKEWL